MTIQQIMRIMDSSSQTRRTIERSLHEIDRRALNAMVLVKRHGNKLASYGVVAQSFREHAMILKDAAVPLQHLVAPLVRSELKILQNAGFDEIFRRAAGMMQDNDRYQEFLQQWKVNRQQSIGSEETEGLSILRRLVKTVERLQEGIAEQEYVVTNGRIEAALSEQSGAPLMRVSQEMGLAVSKVREAIWKYRAELEEVLHENSAGF